MKKLYFFILSILFSLTALAQDLIVTQSGDSINCKLLEQNKSDTYAAYLQNGKVTYRHFFSKEVQSIQKNHYKNTVLPADFPMNEKAPNKIRFALRHGYGYRLAPVATSIPSNNQTYLEHLKKGYIYNGETDYYITPKWGVGIVANFFSTSESANILYFYDATHFTPAALSNKHSISYIGPSVSYENLSHNSMHSFVIRYSLGYL